MWGCNLLQTNFLCECTCTCMYVRVHVCMYMYMYVDFQYTLAVAYIMVASCTVCWIEALIQPTTTELPRWRSGKI